MVAWQTRNGNVALLGGVRTPFVKAGDSLREMTMIDLARPVIQETLYRCGWPAGAVDEVILGNVVMPADAANPARVAAVEAGVPTNVPAITVHRNCASGMEAVAQAAGHVNHGQMRMVLAGGAESMSNIPLLFPLSTLKPVTRLMKAKSLWQKIKALASFRPRHLQPVAALEQGLTDPLSGMLMGKTADLLAHEFGLSRSDQDGFSLRSHQLAAQASKQGCFDHQIMPLYAATGFAPVTADVGPRANQTMEALAKLRPIFDRRDGTVTVGNSCQITDGAAALLVGDGSMARAEGIQPLGYIRAYAAAALEPHRMGLGPVYAIDQILRMTNLTLSDIDLFEINEAFAAQVLACLKAMASDQFCQQKLGRSEALGELGIERLNVNGGAIALGHPVGATGARIVLNLLHEMCRRNVARGIASLCVGGGQGAAILLERK